MVRWAGPRTGQSGNRVRRPQPVQGARTYSGSLMRILFDQGTPVVRPPRFFLHGNFSTVDLLVLARFFLPPSLLAGAIAVPGESSKSSDQTPQTGFPSHPTTSQKRPHRTLDMPWYNPSMRP